MKRAHDSYGYSFPAANNEANKRGLSCVHLREQNERRNMKHWKERINWSPRIRFNWGYHNGANGLNLANYGYLYTHYDKPYLAGWQLGHRDKKEGTYSDDSLPPWKEYGGK